MDQEKIIIIIDDQEEWLEILREWIEDASNYVVETYQSFELAEKRLTQKTPYDLVITDIYPDLENFQNRKGLDFAKFVTSLKKIPVIIISGRASFENTREAFRDCNVIDVFEKKTITRTEFVQQIEKALNAPNLPVTIGGLKDIHVIVDKNRIQLLQQQTGQIIGNITFAIQNQHHVNKIDELMPLLPPGVSDAVAKYPEDRKTELNYLLRHIDELKLDRQKLYSEIMNELCKIAETNEMVKEYLMQISNGEKTQNENIIKNKLNLSLPLIPGILSYNTSIDLIKMAKQTENTEDANIATTVQKKLARIYLNLLKKLKLVK